MISRVALFNLNFEYFVFNPWLEKLATILNPTPATNSTTSAAPSSSENVAVSTKIPLPAQFNMSLSDCTIGLNPLDLPSRGLLLVTSTTVRGQWDFRDGGRGKFDVSLNRVHLFCIDNTTNLVLPARPTRIRSGARKEYLNHFSVRLFTEGC